MSKRPDIYLAHMRMAIDKIEEYIDGYDLVRFASDSRTIDAVIRQFEVLGEAAGKVPISLTKDSPIAWAKIIGMRHRLIHDYMGVDVDIVWETAKNGLGELGAWLTNYE